MFIYIYYYYIKLTGFVSQSPSVESKMFRTEFLGDFPVHPVVMTDFNAGCAERN